MTTLVLQGESGGANLALATALKAKRDGRLDRIDGVYAMVPYISGGYGWDTERKLRELPSMVENEGHYLNCAMMDMLVAVYDPTGENAENPLCWPYFATEADVEGMPPHVITVNELDPLRDEGIAYFRTAAARRRPGGRPGEPRPDPCRRHVLPPGGHGRVQGDGPRHPRLRGQPLTRTCSCRGGGI